MGTGLYGKCDDVHQSRRRLDDADHPNLLEPARAPKILLAANSAPRYPPLSGATPGNLGAGSETREKSCDEEKKE